MLSQSIFIKGCREHNLKNIDLELPRNQFIVITGVSGSGKSSLAFDTIYAEGRRRYVESLSTYARQFLGQMKKPDVDYIGGLSPAISIEQKTTHRNPRSTVGTITEIYDYLRLLYARCGIPHCPGCGNLVQSQSIDQIVEVVLQELDGEKIHILSPIVRGQKGELKKEVQNIQKDGFLRIRLDGQIVHFKDLISIDKNRKHDLDVVIDRIVLKEGIRDRLVDSIETALTLGKGFVHLLYEGAEASVQEKLFSEHMACLRCGISLPELEPNLFSFNSPYGACSGCHGIGEKYQFDENLMIPNSELSILEGGIVSLKNIITNRWYRLQLVSLSHHYNFLLSTAIKDLSLEVREIILYGSKKKKIPVHNQKKEFIFNGFTSIMEKYYLETENDSVKKFYEGFMKWVSCNICRGFRLKKEAIAVTIESKSIIDTTQLSIKNSLQFFQGLSWNTSQQLIGDKILKEVIDRLQFLNNVGLGYLSLDRKVGTLSGGEMQRIRLASQLGSQLVGVLYVLDEPSIGLHQRDNQRLIDTLMSLKNLGNTLIVVEHDEQTILHSDCLVDLGPGAGIHGGEVVAFGSPKEVMANPDSLTAKYLKKELCIDIPHQKRIKNEGLVVLRGCCKNNLKNITVCFPLSQFIVITGVSGSGKSTLINDIFYPALREKVYGLKEEHSSCIIEGYENINKIIRIDQSPIGRTPRSNPATYTGVFTLMRELFSGLPEAKIRGYQMGRFSFNVKGGRCESCSGDGSIRIEMHFLPDIYISCDVCQGKRYNQETLEVCYKGKNIADILDLNISEALKLFENITKIHKKLKTLEEVGLGYIKLGQSATTLSGGEAQRVKLATELSKRSTGKTIYLLDEPTTGLHFDDVNKLVQVLNRFVENGNTVIVIEHNLDLIKIADYIIDLGPEGGDRGGEIIFSGKPEDIVKHPFSHTGLYLQKLRRSD